MATNMKRIATVDGVKDRLIDVTISSEAIGQPIEGSYVIIAADGDVLLARITDINRNNPVHEKDSFAPMIMKYGTLAHWSGEADIERGKAAVISVKGSNDEFVPWRRNPASGAAVDLVEAQMFRGFLAEKKYYTVLGVIPNSGGLPATIINRHHGVKIDPHTKHDLGGRGSAGALHTGVFGQNGSGKTIMVSMLICGKLGMHRDMGLLMPDTAGDLADSNRHSDGEFMWNYGDVLKAADVQLETVSIADVRLTSVDTLEKKLIPFLRSQLSLGGDKDELLARRIVIELFEGKKTVDVKLLTAGAVVDMIVAQIGFCYATGRTQTDKINDATRLRNNASSMRFFEQGFEPIRKLFDGRESVADIVKGVLSKGRKVIIVMSGMESEDHHFVMHELMSLLILWARINFNYGHQSNALVVLDEAIRWVPEGKADETNELIQKAFRETRKYGLGWYVVSQSMAGISKDVLRECRTKWFGRHLGIGVDREHLEQSLGKRGVRAYDDLETQGGYFWVGVGDDINIGSGQYFSLHPFGGDATTAFIEANPHIFRSGGHAATTAE
jgi:hypothetical protein